MTAPQPEVIPLRVYDCAPPTPPRLAQAASDDDRIVWRPELLRGFAAQGITARMVSQYIAAGKIPAPDFTFSRERCGWWLSKLHAAGLKGIV